MALVVSFLDHDDMITMYCFDKLGSYGFVDLRWFKSESGVLKGFDHSPSCHLSETPAN